MYNDDKKRRKKSKVNKKKQPQKRSFFNQNMIEENPKRSFFNTTIGYERPKKENPKKVKKEKLMIKNEFITSIIMIIIGLTFYLVNENSWWLNIGIIVIFVSLGIEKMKEISLYHFDKLNGYASFLLAIVAILSLFIKNISLVLLLGLWILIKGLLKIIETIYIKNKLDKEWIFFFISSLLSIFVALVLIVNPFKQLDLNILLGSFIILYGIVNLTDVNYLTKIK